MKKVAIGLGLLFAGKWLFDKIHLAQNISLQFITADFAIGFPTSRLRITLQINNPTNATTTVKNLNAKVLFNGVNIGTANNSDSVNIPMNKNIFYNVDVYLSSISTATQILSAIKNKSYQLELDGTITASNILLPINVKYGI